MPLEEMCNKIMKFSTAVLKLPGGGRWAAITIYPDFIPTSCSGIVIT